MKKSIFTTALVVSSILITSCGKDVTPGAVHDDRYISVVIGGAQEAKTRGSIVTTDNIEGNFKLYAYEYDGSSYNAYGTLGSGVVASVDNTANPRVVTLPGLYEWPQTNSLNFYAIYPDAWGSSSFSISGTTTPKFSASNYTVPTAMEGHSDLLYASVEGATKSGSAVKIHFLHALTRVTFQSRVTRNDVGLEEIKVKSITIKNGYSKGTFSFTKGLSDTGSTPTTIDSDAAWTETTPLGDFTASPSKTINTDPYPTSGSTNESDYIGSFFLIPVTSLSTSNVTLEVTISWKKGTVESSTPFEIALPAGGLPTTVTSWDMGKWVNYRLDFNADKLIIGINSVTVEDWEFVNDVTIEL